MVAEHYVEYRGTFTYRGGHPELLIPDDAARASSRPNLTALQAFVWIEDGNAG
jgi:hypothetical protein